MTSARLKNYAVILAGGSGARFGKGEPKQFEPLCGMPILAHSVSAFASAGEIDAIIVVAAEAETKRSEEITAAYSGGKPFEMVAGGKTRAESSRNAIMAIGDEEANVLIHDASRPLVTESLIRKCLGALADCEAVCPAVPVTDTLIETDGAAGAAIARTRDRSLHRLAQTPQCFRLSLIRRAYATAGADGARNSSSLTDDCSFALKYAGAKIRLIPGDPSNIKVTYPDDILLAELILRRRSGDEKQR